jgi:prevent-host-death family protein
LGTVTAFEAKTRFGELLERVSRGEEIVITRHDKPVARIVQVGPRNLDRVQQAVRALDELRQKIGASSKRRAKLSDAEVRSAIEEGRR